MVTLKKMLSFALLLAAGGAVTSAKNIRANVTDSAGSVWYAPAIPQFTLSLTDTLGVANDSSKVVLTITDDKGERTVLRYELEPRLRASQATEMTVEADLKLPGFYRINVTDDGNPVFSRVIGYEPENIVSLPDSRPDFDKFWEEAVAEVHALPMDAQIFTPEDMEGRAYGNSRTLSLVTMSTTGGDKLTGYLLMPQGKGPYPVKITYNGYGGRPWILDLDSDPGLIEFIASTRGQFLNEKDNRYGDWVRYGLSSPQSYYYRGAYQDVVRAIDFVHTLDQTDKSRIYAEGGSQGGAFTYIAAALDDRIAAIAPYIPFMSDFPDFLKMAQWPVNGMVQEGVALGQTTVQTLEIASYFDLKNFARRIKCPVLMGVGLQDPTCPPHTNFAPYNLLTGDVVKEYIIYPEQGHGVERLDWDNRVRRFFNLR